MKTTFATQGTCARFIDIELEGDIVREVRFIGGCFGNGQGVWALVLGMPVEEIIARLQGIECRAGTSCPDQLTRALAGMRLKMAG